MPLKREKATRMLSLRLAVEEGEMGVVPEAIRVSPDRTSAVVTCGARVSGTSSSDPETPSESMFRIVSLQEAVSSCLP